VWAWVQGIESLEAINQDELVRQLVLRMAGLACGGKLPGFVTAVGADAELDAETKATVLELARDETFLLACEDYMRVHGVPALGPRYNAPGSGD
jgi:hypothetical protein